MKSLSENIISGVNKDLEFLFYLNVHGYWWQLELFWQPRAISSGLLSTFSV